MTEAKSSPGRGGGSRPVGLHNSQPGHAPGTLRLVSSSGQVGGAVSVACGGGFDGAGGAALRADAGRSGIISAACASMALQSFSVPGRPRVTSRSPSRVTETPANAAESNKVWPVVVVKPEWGGLSPAGKLPIMKCVSCPPSQLRTGRLHRRLSTNLVSGRALHR